MVLRILVRIGIIILIPILISLVLSIPSVYAPDPVRNLLILAVIFVPLTVFLLL